MSEKHDSEIEFSTIFYNDWLQLAQEMWKQDNDAISIAKTVSMHRVSKLLENQVGGQDYAAANLWAFLLGKLITQQILGAAQQRKQAQNNDNNIA